MIARLALAAALAGSALGAAVVLADEPAPMPAPNVPVVAAAPAAPTPPPSSQGAIVKRDVRIALQVPDPDGGPPWVVQRFSATVPRSPVPRECIGMGRVSGGRIGWIGPGGKFTAFSTGRLDATGMCLTANQLRQARTYASRFTTITFPPGGTPQPLVTVTWGITDAGVRAVVPEREPPLDVGADRAFLKVERGEGTSGWLTGTVEYADGRRARFNRVFVPRVDKGERPIPGTEVVAARAPDPAGGEPWALLVSRGSRGSVCESAPGRLVGTRLGHVDRERGVFYSGGLSAVHGCPGRKREPTRAYPMRITTSIVGGGFPEEPRGRIERRVEASRVVFSGRVHRDVETVTIRTPRDVRTLVPSSHAHVVLAVYDGRFPGGEVTATARMKDGREVTRSLYVE